MMLPFLQILVLAGVAIYLVRLRRAIRCRNEQSWDSLLARLRPDWSAPDLSSSFLWKEELTASEEETWEKMQGPRGLWVMYQNARVMLEMADYAARNSDGVDRVLLETLRSDSMQIRLCVLVAMAQYAFSQASEGVRVNAYRAATLYTAMGARMTQLLQEHAAVIVPDFVAAM